MNLSCFVLFACNYVILTPNRLVSFYYPRRMFHHRYVHTKFYVVPILTNACTLMESC